MSVGENVLAFWRRWENDAVFVNLNLGATCQEVAFDGRGIVRLSTQLDRHGEHVGGTAALRPHEGLIITRRTMSRE